MYCDAAVYENELTDLEMSKLKCSFQGLFLSSIFYFIKFRIEVIKVFAV